MTWIRQYILSITGASLICAAIKMLVGNKGTSALVIRMTTGLFLTIVLIAPIVRIDFAELQYQFDDVATGSSTIIDSGINYALEETSAIIKAKTEAYILDKAASMGAALNVQVSVDDSYPPLPTAVFLNGQVAPYAKERLTHYIADELGIPEARQIWN